MSTQTKDLWTSDDGPPSELLDESPPMSHGLVTRDASNPFALLQDALERGTDPDNLGKLMDLCERHDAKLAEREYAAAMQACQAEMKPVARDQWNDQTKSHYLSAEKLHRELKETWIRHGFTLSYGSADSPYSEHYRCVCVVRHTGGHSTTHFLDAPADDKGIKGAPCKTAVQGVLSTITYLKRNLACLIFDITIEGFDKDGNGRGKATITEEQAIQLQEWIDSKSVNPQRFLEWVGQAKGSKVERLSEMPASMYQQAIDYLKRK